MAFYGVFGVVVYVNVHVIRVCICMCVCVLKVGNLFTRVRVIVLSLLRACVCDIWFLISCVCVHERYILSRVRNSEYLLRVRVK